MISTPNQSFVFQADGTIISRPELRQMNSINTEGVGGARPPQGEMAKHIRKALDCPVKVDFTSVPLTQLLKEFDQNCKLTFIARYMSIEPKVSLHSSQELPLGSVLQAIGDKVSFEFLVRDYGILVVDNRDRVPANAIRVRDFWKPHTAAGSAPAARPDDAQPPK